MKFCTALCNRHDMTPTYFLDSFLCFVCCLAISGSPLLSAQETKTERPWLDKSAPLDQRVDSLLAEMALEEKVGQLTQSNGIGGEATGNTKNLVADSALYELIRSGQLGSILNEINVTTVNEFQRLAVEESRLGIPLIIGRDVIHGFRTIFPLPLGQAATWNPEMVEQACAIAAREARSAGVGWTFAPMVDIARDPRWGRIAESFGEDPYLASSLSAASVRGYQGDDLSNSDSIAACVKHFAGYGAAEGGRDYNATMISPSTMRNVYLPPFQAAVDAGVATLMCGFHDVNGIPMSVHKQLLSNVLRGEWGFEGFVVSDWDSIFETIEHGSSKDERAAALAAAQAGVNMEMSSPCYRKNLTELVTSGQVSETTVDELVKPILRVKFQLGLFEQPYTEPDAAKILLSQEHLDAARKVARQSVVMLKNESSVLPLDKTILKKIAIIGPLADAKRDQLGTWIPDGKEADSQTPLAAIRESAKNNEIEVLYASGLVDDLDRSTQGFAEAVATAEQADIVVLIVGERANISGEARSRATLDLPGAQNELVSTLAKVGKPIILIVQAGRPLTIGKQIEAVDAVLYSFHAGTMAGPALADLLWGIESPSGKLPVTFPKSVGQIPLYYNHVNTGRPPRPYDFAKDKRVDDDFDVELGYNSNYIDVGPYPLFPFGYGLSYSTFTYGDVELSATKLRSGEILAVRVPVSNSGKVAADEIVQLYVRDLVGSLTRPVRELKGFRRIQLEPGETSVVEFALPVSDLGFFNNDEERVLEPGEYEIFVGGSSLAPKVGTLEIVE
ncbi:beta-glucosidase BglX [Bythopirellula polymerisocia]|uniref:beta-glucosidase n=1 Tax=Bythopirellula polymerisocia TaxID=2528003 RepID=A0A5C6CKZ0_9BACT|nr:beta-glucosidase BglX [Bythopirellula polymerisocia]TWU25533.1 Periplasmic beta-glucosidase precursor [Bythopirellula polymerisocia]